MMVDPVFKILSARHSENTIVTLLEVDGGSDIFNGHFPDQPVVPGACMLQTVKEVLADTLKIPVRLIKADNIKFLGLVQPGVDGLILEIAYQHTDDIIKVNANLSVGEQVFMKMQGSFAMLIT